MKRGCECWREGEEGHAPRTKILYEEGHAPTKILY